MAGWAGRAWGRMLLDLARERPTTSRNPVKPCLCAVLASKKMWATHIRYLNDSKEFQYALETLQSAFEAELSESIGTFLLRDFFAKLFANAPWPNIFVLSFSAAGDQLSQWRAYSGDGPGLSLGFDLLRLGELLRDKGLKLEPCVYEAEAQKRLFQPLAKRVVAALPLPADIPDDWSSMSAVQKFVFEHECYIKAIQQLNGDASRELMGDVMLAVADFNALVKHPAFAEEQEWRAVLAADLEGTTLQFRPGRSALLPYVSVPVISNDGKSPLVEIVVGPCPQPDLTCEALKLLVGQDPAYKDAKVRLSETPYRYW